MWSKAEAKIPFYLPFSIRREKERQGMVPEELFMVLINKGFEIPSYMFSLETWNFTLHCDPFCTNSKASGRLQNAVRYVCSLWFMPNFTHWLLRSCHWCLSRMCGAPTDLGLVQMDWSQHSGATQWKEKDWHPSWQYSTVNAMKELSVQSLGSL